MGAHLPLPFLWTLGCHAQVVPDQATFSALFQCVKAAGAAALLQRYNVAEEVPFLEDPAAAVYQRGGPRDAAAAFGYDGQSQHSADTWGQQGEEAGLGSSRGGYQSASAAAGSGSAAGSAAAGGLARRPGVDEEDISPEYHMRLQQRQACHDHVLSSASSSASCLHPALAEVFSACRYCSGRQCTVPSALVPMRCLLPPSATGLLHSYRSCSCCWRAGSRTLPRAACGTPQRHSPPSSR